MPLLKIPIPDEIDKAISSVSSDKNGFILEAVKQKLQETKSKPVEEKLIEGYKNNHDENSSLTEDFKQADLENWDEY